VLAEKNGGDNVSRIVVDEEIFMEYWLLKMMWTRKSFENTALI